MAAAETFGSPISDGFVAEQLDGVSPSDEDRAFVTAQYEATQQMLADNGIDAVEVYRGIHGTDEIDTLELSCER